MDQVVFMDFEASSFRDGYPVEVGWAWVEGSDVQAESLLISPADEWLTPAFTWDPIAESIHGLPLSRLQSEGKTPAYVCQELNTQMEGKVVVFDTGPDGVDRHWLDLLFSEAGDKRLFKLGGAASDMLKAMAARHGLGEAQLTAIQSSALPMIHHAAQDAAYYACCAVGIQLIAAAGATEISVDRCKSLVSGIKIVGIGRSHARA